METVNFSLGLKILMFEWILLVGQPSLHCISNSFVVCLAL